MPKLSERGVIQFIVPLILLGGIIVGVWLVTAGPLKLFPRAVSQPISGPINSQTSFSLTSSKGMYSPDQTFEVKVLARSIESANLFSAKMTFPTKFLEVIQIKTDNSFVKNWVEQYYDNQTGNISLIGGIPNPGYQTNQEVVLMAAITFKAKDDLGKAEIAFTDDSEILSNNTNINILTIRRNLTLNIDGLVCAQVITYAKNPQTGECREFPTPCDVLEGWIKVSSCASAYTYPTPSAYTYPTPSAYSTPVYVYPTPGTSYYYPTPYVTPSYATPAYGTPTTAQVGAGDGNNDGKVNLIDMSVLLTDFNKTGNIRGGIDMNGDGVINTFDFGLMRNLLIQRGVIKG